MARYNQKNTRTAATHVMTSTGMKPSAETKTHEGAHGYAREVKSELFIRATSSFAGQGSFYENADKRDMRLVELTHKLAITDEGWEWLSGFLPWLRGEGNMRTAPILIASEAVKARLDAKLPSPAAHTHRSVLASVMQRADEPGEMLAYWLAIHGRSIPKPIKRAIADAAQRLYTERNFLRYDSAARGIRFADVLELSHPTPKADWQGALFTHAIDVRHGKPLNDQLYQLTQVSARIWFNEKSPSERHAIAASALERGSEALQDATAGQWEWLLSTLGDTTDVKKPLTKKEQWELVLPQVGYMALIRNLRNLDEAGIDNATARKLAARIADPEQVTKSKQFPFRFYSAYVNAPSLRWGQALEEALDHSLKNIPELKGRTLVLIDTSGSMQSTVSAKSQMTCVMQAAIFGLALKLKNYDNVDVYGFASGQFRVDPDRGTALLSLAKQFDKMVGSVGHGTNIDGSLRATFKAKDHDRVILLSDMQTVGVGYHDYFGSSVPKNVPVYAWNLAGYSNSPFPSGGNTNRYDLAGMTDSAFRMIQQIEAGKNSQWPWLEKNG
jgi:hypothetical protein